MVLDYVPSQYKALATAWGIRHVYGPLFALGATILLIFALVWLGTLLSFGRLIRENESAKKALIIISTTIAIVAAFGAAEFIVNVLSNLIYTISMFGAIFVLVAVVRALWAGVPAAGATVAEAKKLEYEAKAAMEKARREYEEEKHMRMLALKKIVDELASLAQLVESFIDEILNNLKNNPHLAVIYSKQFERLSQIKTRLVKSKNKPAAIYAALNDAMYILSEISDNVELDEKIRYKAKELVNKIASSLKKIRG